MGNSKAIGRRGRVLRRANDRAQRRFHDMLDAGVWSDPFARATILYIQAERLVDAIMLPEVNATPIEVVIEALRWPYAELTPSEAVMLAYQRGLPLMTATYMGTRCCGATSVHWVGCKQRLDVNDPRSFIGIVDYDGDDAPFCDQPFCDQCGVPIGEGAMPFGEFPDGEGGMFNLCDQCTAGVH